VTGGKPIAVLLQSISGVSAINPLVAFTTSMEQRERCYYFILATTRDMFSFMLLSKTQLNFICPYLNEFIIFLPSLFIYLFNTFFL
jgi:hypothetical protein